MSCLMEVKWVLLESGDISIEDQLGFIGEDKDSKNEDKNFCLGWYH